MALWVKIQQLPQDVLQQVRSVYGEHFPIEVRHFLSSWIEEQIWTEIENPENPQFEQYITNIVISLIQELESKAASLNTDDMFITKIKLMEAAKNFRQRYTHNPTMLYRIISHCLGTEMKLLGQVENLGGNLMNMAGGKVGLISDAIAEIAQHVESLRRRTQETGEDLRKMEQEQEAFAISYHECTKHNAHLQHLATQPQNQQNLDMEKKIRRQKEQQEQVLNHKATGLMQLRLTIADKLKDTITRLNSLQSRVLDDELIRWKRDQQLAGNGAPFNNNLDSIQEWCESLAELIWLNRQQIKEAERLKQKFALEPPGMQDILPTLNSQITQLLSSLVTSTFIIEKQPPQVMKTNTRFTSTVRLLVGGKLNVHMTPPQVKVSIISEAQANALLKSDKMSKNGEASGDILNNTGSMEYHQATRQLSVSFRNMQLKKIKRAEKKGTESVMDEKFSLLFQSQFSVGGGELVFQVWTLSLPVVVIVHGNQEPHAWATVTWDNAFAEPGRVPFAVPDKVPWGQVAEALNVKFRSATGRSLTEDNLRFLAEKAFRGGNANGQDYTGLLLSWAQFCKEPLPERNFTFWEWFYAVMKLTREHLRGPWIDGYILGFVRKKQAEEMLASCASGTFLMRFSDSELGGVTIAWVGDQTEVFMLQPFTSKDFAIRSLADRVFDLQHLLYLYPDLSKDQAFSKYYTPFTENQSTSTNGYVKPFLVTHIPGWGGPGVGGQTPSHSSVIGVGSSGQSGAGGSYPATPSTMFQAHSPDPSVTRDTPSVASSNLSNNVLGIDCEWTNEGPVSLLQLATFDGVCGLFRIGKIGYVPQKLKELLASKHILKVGVASYEDGQKITADYGCRVCGTLDLRSLAERSRLPSPKSLAAMSLEYLDVEMDKLIEVRCSNWNADILTDEQVAYAACDAIASVLIYDQIVQRIKQRYSLWENCVNYIKCVCNKNVNTQFYYIPNAIIDTRFKVQQTHANVNRKNVKNSKPDALKQNSDANDSIVRTNSIPTRNKPLYHNCYLQAPDGDTLCTCDRKKAEWYITKGLGEVVQQEPFTVRLKFEPSGRALGEVGKYYTQIKVNQCVVCGSTEKFIRKSVVPREYRKYFPLVMKAHQSHDILLLCPICHEISNCHDLQLRRKLADICDAPLAGPLTHIHNKYVKNCRKLHSAIKALTEKATLPDVRRKELEHYILECTGQSQVTPFFLDVLTKELKNDMFSASNNDQSQCQSHGLKVVQYFEKREGGLVELERIWREHFLLTMKPKHLPSLWSVCHNQERLIIRQSQNRIEPQDAIAAGLKY